ncbi:hypothetical protein KFK09_026803 [Dendrobium nobile]|uniref:RIN4 pathogenic type III effector avirulence factor Avr cleavage site domain-containing protein n=1 Tax=Dendrobium nobile TaxID=94219 RepID=A0A8T3A8J9_DENNO|nr:hypothetical protein KFK09_026803 [Dendrobium nobile]
MELSAHVPKFGNWEDKDIPYTIYFENARKEIARGFNPNDPEHNPEAFMPRHPVQQQHSGKKQSKSSSQKANTDPPRISAKLNSYSDKSNSNTSVSHKQHSASISSQFLINAVPSSSIDSEHIESVHQKRTFNAMVNKVEENKKTVPANTKISKNRNAKQRTSSKVPEIFFFASSHTVNIYSSEN